MVAEKSLAMVAEKSLPVAEKSLPAIPFLIGTVNILAGAYLLGAAPARLWILTVVQFPRVLCALPANADPNESPDVPAHIKA